MTDRELLELAAVAGGYQHYEYVENEYRDGKKRTGHYCDLLEVCINPLIDDADAFRLQYQLNLMVGVADKKEVRVFCWDDTDMDEIKEEITKNSFYERGIAIRRAIVRAAAEIGKLMVFNEESK